MQWIKMRIKIVKNGSIEQFYFSLSQKQTKKTNQTANC